MDLCNYHTHCDFCDGKAPAEEFVKAAVAAGFHSYGISSHAPLPFRTNWTLERERVPAYLAEVERLKRKYAPVMELYVGMEIDYVTEEWNPSSAYFRELPLDYRVGAVHFVAGAGGEFMDIDGPADIFQANMRRLFDGDLRRLVETYFDASERMVEAGGFDFIAHPDKIAMNALTVDAEVTEREWYENRVSGPGSDDGGEHESLPSAGHDVSGQALFQMAGGDGRAVAGERRHSRARVCERWAGEGVRVAERGGGEEHDAFAEGKMGRGGD